MSNLNFSEETRRVVSSIATWMITDMSTATITISIATSQVAKAITQATIIVVVEDHGVHRRFS